MMSGLRGAWPGEWIERRQRWVEVLGVRGLSLADKVVEITNLSAIVVVREGKRNVFMGWQPRQGVYYVSRRMLTNKVNFRDQQN